MKYCNRCGAPAQKKSATHYVCSSCKTDHYKNPKGAVALLLFDSSGALMLARRAKAPKKGTLDPIGGFLDIGESFEQALFRELKEETGLTAMDISDPTYLGSVHDFYPWQGDQESVVSVYFTATLNSTAIPTANDDVATLEHLPLKDVPDDELAWDGLRTMLAKLQPRLD